MAIKKKIIKKKREDAQLLITVELKDKLVLPKEILITIKGDDEYGQKNIRE